MNEKIRFLREQYIPLLRKLQGNEKGQWGVLSAQGMVEHMTESVAIAWGRIKQTPYTSADLLPRYREFALSDKEFKPDTKNAYMDAGPAPLLNVNMREAIEELETELSFFFRYYSDFPEATAVNPFFGRFNFAEWLHLLYKHARHHLKQFGLL